MNLELNTMSDHGEEKIRWTQLSLPIDILVLKRYNSGGSAETKEIYLRTLSGENKLWGNLLAVIRNPGRKDFNKKTRSIFWNLPLYYRSVWPDREVWQIHSHAIPPEEQAAHLQEDFQWTAKTNAKPLKKGTIKPTPVTTHLPARSAVDLVCRKMPAAATATTAPTAFQAFMWT